MCKDKSALLLELEEISSAAAAGNGKKATAARSGRTGTGTGVVAGTGRHKNKVSAWTGVRFRHSGKWATEIRMPRTREKVWVGTFASPRQAALAYDAAVFCFFGERTPKARKINFPAAPRPDISESARLQLGVAEVKAISEKHARDVDALLPPLPDADDSTAAPDDDLVVVPAATPVAVDAPPSAGTGGTAPADCADEEEDDLDRLIRAFDIDAFEAELDAVTFLVSDEEYTELCA